MRQLSSAWLALHERFASSCPHGDLRCLKIWAVLGGIATLLDPERIVIGGVVAHAGS